MKIEREVSTVHTRHVLRVIRLTGIGGQFVKPGKFVEVCAIESADLVRREMAVAATADELAQSPAILVAPPSPYGTFQPGPDKRSNWVTGWRN